MGRQEAIIVDMAYGVFPPRNKSDRTPPSLRGLCIEHVRGESRTRPPIFLRGLPEAHLQDLAFRDVHLHGLSCSARKKGMRKCTVGCSYAHGACASKSVEPCPPCLE